ncbi:MAG: MOSC domain-containing protein [Anaerolineaceae bacterium]|nr:MOSC domain-containing protein [Anaerolineaceae bacterium]
MHIVSVNVGTEKAISGKSGTSGIFKDPANKPIFVGTEGLQDDVIIDTKNHGGADQAVYVYGTTDYDWWSDQLDRDLPPGLFGENLTISELESADLAVGDRLQMNEVILEVTAPRIPCVTFATRMEDPQFVKKFAKAGRYGAYCRVIQTGPIAAGEQVRITRYDGERISINELADAFYKKPKDKAVIKRFLSVPIAIRDRNHYQHRLAKLTE